MFIENRFKHSMNTVSDKTTIKLNIYYDWNFKIIQTYSEKRISKENGEENGKIARIKSISFFILY